MPLIRRIPKRGFNNQWGPRVAVVNVSDLDDRFKTGDEVTLESLKAAGLCKGAMRHAENPGQRRADQEAEDLRPSVQRSALEKIQKAGGEASS